MPLRLERLLTLLAIPLAALLVCLAAAEHWALRDLKFDDAWIHFQYAKRIAEGHGVQFNVGDRVLGTGGILWNVVVAPIILLWGEDAVATGSSVLNFALLLTCAGVLFAALRDILPVWLVVLVPCAVVFHEPMMTGSVGGMESVFLNVLFFSAFLNVRRGRLVVAGLLAGAAVWVRIESVFLVASIIAAAAIVHRPQLRRVAFAAAALPIFLVATCWLWFGTPIAHSTLAKRVVFQMPPWSALAHNAVALEDVLHLRGLVSWAVPDGTFQVAFGLLAWVALVLLGARLLWRHSPAAAFVAGQPMGALVFYAIGNPLMFRWYFNTFAPLAGVFACLGLVEFFRSFQKTAGAAAPLAGLGVLLLGAGTTRAEWYPVFEGETAIHWGYEHPEVSENLRTFRYIQVAQWLNRHAGPTDTVCISEIGAFAYHFRGRILDGVGLVSPEAVPYHPLSAPDRRNGSLGAIPPRLVRDKRPEFLVTLPVFAEGVLADPWFRENYVLVGCWPWMVDDTRFVRVPATLWGYQDVLAFRRADVPWVSEETPACSARAPDAN